MKILYATSEMAPLCQDRRPGATSPGRCPRRWPTWAMRSPLSCPYMARSTGRRSGATLVMPEILVDLPARPPQAGRVADRAGQRHSTRHRLPCRGRRPCSARPQLYDENGKEYPDNPLRFAYFCMAALWMLHGVGFIPDLIHCNDLADGPHPRLSPIQPLAARRPGAGAHAHDPDDSQPELPRHPRPGPCWIRSACPPRRSTPTSSSSSVTRTCSRAAPVLGRLDDHGEPPVCPRDPDARVWLRAGGLPATALGAADGHPERDRQRGVGPAGPTLGCAPTSVRAI